MESKSFSTMKKIFLHRQFSLLDFIYNDLVIDIIFNLIILQNGNAGDDDDVMDIVKPVVIVGCIFLVFVGVFVYCCIKRRQFLKEQQVYFIIIIFFSKNKMLNNEKVGFLKKNTLLDKKTGIFVNNYITEHSLL